jgi:hypothetical protein
MSHILLKEYIRQTLTAEPLSLLKESANVSNLALYGDWDDDQDYAEVALVDVSKFRKVLKELQRKKDWDKKDPIPLDKSLEFIVGYVGCSAPLGGNAWGAWEINAIAGRGYGKILYGIAYALSPKGLLMPDRDVVSDAAKGAWKKASKTHDSLKLDRRPPNNKTERTIDDAKLHGEKGREYLDRAYKAQGWEKVMFDQLDKAGELLDAEMLKVFKDQNIVSLVGGRIINDGKTHSDAGCGSNTPSWHSLSTSFLMVSLWTFCTGKAWPG